MRKMSLAGLLAVSLFLPLTALAQPAAPDTQPTAPRMEPPAPRMEQPAAPDADAEPSPSAEPERRARPARKGRRGQTGKRAECLDQARTKGLRRNAMRDAALICYQEARLDCLKKAVADGVAPRERRDYIANCLGEEPRGSRPSRRER